MADVENEGAGVAAPQIPNGMQVVIREAMLRMGIDPMAVTANLRFQNIRFAVMFRCVHCGNRIWTSAWGWFTVDLREQRIKRRYRQLCVSCAAPCRPMIRHDRMTEFAELVISWYITCRDQGPNAPGGNEPREPRTGIRSHRPDHCEKCHYGARPCWLPRNAQNYFPAWQTYCTLYPDFIETFY